MNYIQIDEFYNLCYISKKWNKWSNDSFNINNKLQMIKICGHYLFSHPIVKNIINELNITDYIKITIKQKLSNLMEKIYNG